MLIKTRHHDALPGYVANEHIDHTAVSILTGGILSGGGTIAANRTISLVNGDVDHDQLANFDSNEHYLQSAIVATGALNSGSITSGFGPIDVGASGISTNGNGSFGLVTILSPTPILVFKDSNSLGAASVGYIEWRDSGGGRAGFLGNNSSGNDDLYWKNEQGGNIGIETTGAGELQIFAATNVGDQTNKTLFASDGSITQAGSAIATLLQLEVTNNVGFYGTTPVTQNQLQTDVGATVDNVITELQRLGLVRQAA